MIVFWCFKIKWIVFMLFLHLFNFEKIKWINKTYSCYHESITFRKIQFGDILDQYHNKYTKYNKANDQFTIMNNHIQRKQFDKFNQDFSFLVYGKEYKTNSFAPNALSSIISKSFTENNNLALYWIHEFNEMKTFDFNEEEKIGFWKCWEKNSERKIKFFNHLEIFKKNYQMKMLLNKSELVKTYKIVYMK